MSANFWFAVQSYYIFLIYTNKIAIYAKNTNSDNNIPCVGLSYYPHFSTISSMIWNTSALVSARSRAMRV